MNIWDTHKTESGLCNLVRLVCIRLEKSDTKYTLEQIPELFNEAINEAINEARLQCVHTFSSDVYEEIRSLVADFFMPSFKEELFHMLLSCASKRRSRLTDLVKARQFFFSPDIISQYLDVYYDLVSYVYLNNMYFKSDRPKYVKILDLLLNVDICFSEKEGYTFLSPMVMDGINHLYRILYDYQFKVKKIQNELKISNYREVIISKILRLFRWKLVHNGRIMQAALPAYISQDNGKILSIPVKDLSLYNSYEGIGELRLLDKILYEIDRCKINNKNKHGDEEKDISLVVSLIGDVNEIPMRVFIDAICSNLKNDNKYNKINFNIKFLIYTKNPYDEVIYNKHISNDEKYDKCIDITYNVIEYINQLKEKRSIENIVSDSNIVFVLDSCDIYTPYETKSPDETDMVAFFANYDSYDKYFERTNYGDLKKEDGFHDLVRQLYSIQYSGRTGYFKRDLNVGLLTYIKGLYKEYNSNKDGEEKVMYIYASDAESFDKMFFEEESFARVERYHDKQMAIMRISREPEKPLVVGDENALPIIVFTLWQFIKHTAIRNLIEIKDYFSLDNSYIYILKEIKIGVDYSRWPERLDFYYELPYKIEANDIVKNKFINYLEQVVMPIFGQHDTDMYYDYFVKASASFLYSDVKNVSDMLFLHLFVDKHKLLGDTYCMGYYDDLEKHRPNGCKYSEKRYYEYIMRDYDTSSENFDKKHEKLNLLNKGGENLRETIFAKIKIACERNSYIHSYLYERCIEMSS